MVNLKPANQSSQTTPTIHRRGFSLQQLLWFILASILVHGLGLLMLARYQRFQPIPEAENDSTPIEFVTIPEESEAEPPPETKNRATENSVAEKNIEPESTTDDIAPSSTSTPDQELAPPPVPPAPPEPKPIPEPPEPKPIAETIPEPFEPSKPAANNQPSVLSDADAASTPIAKPTPTKTKSPVATKLPPKIEPTPEPETTPTPTAPPTQPENSAASLLGGDYQKTLANGGGDAFFSPEALSFNTVLDPGQLNALKGFDPNPYLSHVKQKLRPNWNPDRTQIRSTLLNVEILRNGQIAKLEIARSSGSQEFDLKNLETFRKSAPFDPLPPEFPLESFKFKFEFHIID